MRARIRWRNLALFALSLAVALWVGWLLAVPPVATVTLYGCGVWAPAMIVKLRWME